MGLGEKTASLIHTASDDTAVVLHSSLWFPGDFPTELIGKKKKNSRPPASKEGKVLPEKQ